MSRVIGKSQNGNTIRRDFRNERAAERFCEMWEWSYDNGEEKFNLEIINFVS